MLYDDEDHDLFVTPLASTYSGSKGGASRHMIVNGRDHPVAVKIKCSNNTLYRVSPVFCNLDAGASIRLQIVRDAGQPGTDKIVILYRPSLFKNPREAFKKTIDGPPKDISKKLIALIAKDDYDEEEDEPPTGPPPPVPKSTTPQVAPTPSVPKPANRKAPPLPPALPSSALPPPSPPPPLPTSQPPSGRRHTPRTHASKKRPHNLTGPPLLPL